MQLFRVFACVACALALTPVAARAEPFADPLCPAAVRPANAYADLAAHLPQPPDRVLGAIGDVVAAYRACQQDGHESGQLETENYAYVQLADWHIRRALIEGRLKHTERANADLDAAIGFTDIVLGFADRAYNPGNNTHLQSSGSQPIQDLRHDSVPSIYHRFAKTLHDRAVQLRGMLAEGPKPAESPR